MVLRLIVGLGNTGAQYQNHRHNFGFLWLDSLAQDNHARWQSRLGGLLAQCTIGENRILLLKPQEMMNLSGRSVGKIARYYDIAASEILVAYDELALPVGKVRIKQGGGANGHNGIKDIVRHFGADFHRLRMGIDHPGDKSLVHSHVLSNFRAEERQIVDAVIDDASRYTDLLIAERFGEFMNKLSHHAPKASPSETPS